MKMANTIGKIMWNKRFPYAKETNNNYIFCNQKVKVFVEKDVKNNNDKTVMARDVSVTALHDTPTYIDELNDEILKKYGEVVRTAHFSAEDVTKILKMVKNIKNNPSRPVVLNANCQKDYVIKTNGFIMLSTKVNSWTNNTINVPDIFWKIFSKHKSDITISIIKVLEKGEDMFYLVGNSEPDNKITIIKHIHDIKLYTEFPKFEKLLDNFSVIMEIDHEALLMFIKKCKNLKIDDDLNITIRHDGVFFNQSTKKVLVEHSKIYIHQTMGYFHAVYDMNLLYGLLNSFSFYKNESKTIFIHRKNNSTSLFSKKDKSQSFLIMEKTK